MSHDDRYGDGRFIDPSVGLLEGEAAQQATPERRAGTEGSVPFEVWSRSPHEHLEETPEEPTYYDRPTLKEPVWIWAVPAYFYTGGAAGAASVLAAAAQLAGRGRFERLIRRGHWIGAAGTSIGSALLIYDLGRPERFVNMLRVFRPTSAMNMGSWILASASSASAGAALLSRSNGRAKRFGDTAGLAAGITGMPLAGYTAVLLADTAVPLWQQARRTLPFLFIGSAMSTAASLLEMGELDDDEEQVVKMFGIVGKAAELAATVAVERELDQVEGLGRPLREGLAGSLWKTTKATTAASLALSLLPGKSRVKSVMAGLLGNAGSLALRFAVFYAGKASARDPRATFRQQRAGRGAAEVTEKAAVTGAHDERAV